MVELPNGKMKSREGTVVDADDLIASMIQTARALSEDKVNKLEDITEAEKNEIARIVGLGALKYFILKVDARKNMLFNSGRVNRLQRQHGSVHSIYLRTYLQHSAQAAAQGIAIPTAVADNAPMNEKEIALIQKMNDFWCSCSTGRRRLQPERYCELLLRTYKRVQPVLPRLQYSERRHRRRKDYTPCLGAECSKVIKNGMELLGIEVPERM